MPSSSINQDKELAEFFTDVEHLREVFKNSVAAPTLTKRLLVIHGVGGVGKSSLLKMLRLHCKGAHVPVALASGDEAKSALDVLARWTEDLKADGVAFPTFGKTYEHYRAIQAKVDEQSKKAQDARGRAADIAGKAASKTAEAAGGALAGAAIGSVIPGIGTAIGGALGGVLGGMGAEALVDWLRGFLPKPDIDLLLDPAKKLTDDFLADVAPAADKRRLVLMLDTFEQMPALDDWVRDVAQRVGQFSKLSYGVLLVIVGRALPNWSRAWQGWMATAQVEELKPMSEDDMRELVRRYYATMRGGEPNPAQVDAIIRFARGLPMVVTSAVQLWVKYGVEDFQSVKAEIVANLVDRLIEGVPSALIPALEAAAIVRWFDQPILRAVMKQDDVRDVYNELRRFPFVRTRVEGLALHDAVREIMDENLRAQDSERHCELHERAAAYFEKRLEKVAGEEAERLGLERLYHRVRADEEAGIKLFQEMAEELTRYRLVNRLRALLNDVNTYPLERENSKLWGEYYSARLAHLQARFTDAMSVYEAIGENEHAEPKLRAYALCDLGYFLTRYEPLSRKGGVREANSVLQRSQEFAPNMDAKLIFVQFLLGDIAIKSGELEKGLDFMEKRLRFFQEKRDLGGILHSLHTLRCAYAAAGDWRMAQVTVDQGLQLLQQIPANPFLKLDLVASFPWHLIWTGRYFEAENVAREVLAHSHQKDDVDSLPSELRDLGLILGLEGKWSESESCFKRSFSATFQRGTDWLGEVGIAQGLYGKTLIAKGDFDNAKEQLLQSMSNKQKFRDDIGMPEVSDWLGELHEVKANHTVVAKSTELVNAESYYRQTLDLRWTSRFYFECGALTGLVRVKHAQGDYAAIPPLLTEAEQLAQQYEYNDHLASLRLTQGMTADITGLNGQTSPTSHSSVQSSPSVVIGHTALDYFKQAMVYALRYNRFLLDGVLSGRPQGTPLRPIIPYCVETLHATSLLVALRDWWKTGVNDIGTPRPDTISPIPEGIALLEAERIAREREPGDGSPQPPVVEQIEKALQNQQ